MTVNKEEKAPVPNDSTPIWNLVVQDMQERNEVGKKKYGTPLQAFNGRNALIDLYQELLDAVVYVRQHLEEQKITCEKCKCEKS
jgi:hypothetical protein